MAARVERMKQQLKDGAIAGWLAACSCESACPRWGCARTSATDSRLLDEGRRAGGCIRLDEYSP
eukprot:5784794-Prorocentrum_lima.AAC.1